MIELEFRAYSKIFKKYIFKGFHFFGEVLTFDMFGQFISENWQEYSKHYDQKLLAVNDFLIEQFIGRNDKNGNKIYENDIIRGGAWTRERYAVIFDQHNCQFCGRTKYGEIYFLTETDEEYCKIIGNINENIELLR